MLFVYDAWLIIVKNPGLLFVLICFFLYKVLTTSLERSTAATLDFATSSLTPKFFWTASIISGAVNKSFLRVSNINASKLSISL